MPKPEPYSAIYEPPSNLAMSAFAAAAAMVAYQPPLDTVPAPAPAPANWSEAKDIKQLTPDQLRQAYQVLLPAVLQQVQTMCCSDAKKNAAAATDCLSAAACSQAPALVAPVAAAPAIRA